MPSDELSPERFSAAYFDFLNAMRRRVPAAGPVLIDRIRTHLGVAGATEGASPAWIKELLRRAAVLSVAEGGSIAVTQSHLNAAYQELASSGLLGQRMLGFQSVDGEGACL